MSQSALVHGFVTLSDLWPPRSGYGFSAILVGVFYMATTVKLLLSPLATCVPVIYLRTALVACCGRSVPGNPGIALGVLADDTRICPESDFIGIHVDYKFQSRKLYYRPFYGTSSGLVISASLLTESIGFDILISVRSRWTPSNSL